jgi:hypothetical protein
MASDDAPFSSLSLDLLVERIFDLDILDVGDLARLRAVSRATRDAVAMVRPKEAIRGILHDVVVHQSLVRLTCRIPSISHGCDW